MVAVKTVVVSVVAMLSVFLQSGIRAQPTIGSSAEYDSCSQLEEELEFQVVENKRLQSVLESGRQKIEALESDRRRLRTGELQLVTATFIGGFDQSPYHEGITKVEDNIYVLNLEPNIINVYEDLIGFHFIRDIALSGTNYANDIVYSNESKCVYISDYDEKCIWVMTTIGEHRLTKWMNNVTEPHTLSLSNEGHLLVLRQSQSFSQDSLEIYSLNATLIRTLHLPLDIKDSRHVVQTSTGDFLLLHRLNNATDGPWVISQLTNDGHLIHRFIPRNQSEQLNAPSDLSLDSENNRLFVADYGNNRVILLDSSVLGWRQVLLSKEINGIRDPWRLFYDASKKHLFVAQSRASVAVYEIN